MRHMNSFLGSPVFNVWIDGGSEEWCGSYERILIPEEKKSSQFGVWKLSEYMFIQQLLPPICAWFQCSNWAASLRTHQLRVERNEGRGSRHLLVKHLLISFVLETRSIMLNPPPNSVRECYNYFIWNEWDSKRWTGSSKISLFIFICFIFF